MAKILVLGGGFGGVVAAESIANQLGNEHQITLVARSDRFVFYPALVSLAFGKCSLDDASFDLRKSMLSRNINFIEAEVARLDLERRKVVTALGEVEGTIPYDYLVFALGRRLATERTPGFFEHSHHLLDPEGALKFGEAVRNFSSGDVVLGQCSGARLPVPVYETAFALAKRRKENATRITVVSPTSLESEFGDANVAQQLETALRRNRVEYLPHFPVDCIERDRIISRDGRALKYDLLMLLPAFSQMCARLSCCCCAQTRSSSARSEPTPARSRCCSTARCRPVRRGCRSLPASFSAQAWRRNCCCGPPPVLWLHSARC